MGRYDQYSDEELIVRLREGETEISDYLMENIKNLSAKGKSHVPDRGRDR